MSFLEKFEYSFRAILPSPFSIAIILTLVVFALGYTVYDGNSFLAYSSEVSQAWEKDLWNSKLLAFAVQMMLMLILGHVLALSKPISNLLDRLTSLCSTNFRAIFFCAFFTIIIALFNWGLGLIFGAIFARKIAENASLKGIPINYPLVAAAGYSGLMVWHGGISGSAPIKVAEKGHLSNLGKNILDPDSLAKLPEAITYDQSIFSSMNIFVSILLLIVVPFALAFLAKFFKTTVPSIKTDTKIQESNTKLLFAEKIDQKSFLALSFGGLILIYLISKIWNLDATAFWAFSFISPNFINLLLLSLALIFHRSISQFLKGLDFAIGGASGILIQFPLYFGIMGIMKASGLITHISEYLISISTDFTFPLFTFFSAGLVNIFVPSGGGQWMVQGPIILKAALSLNVPISKAVMALAYGDQVTNMLQPFWALPLLGITKLKASQILPYTLICFVLGSVVFILGLIVF